MGNSSNGGKGDRQRPTDHEAFSKAFERIFGKKPSEDQQAQGHCSTLSGVLPRESRGHIAADLKHSLFVNRVMNSFVNSLGG